MKKCAVELMKRRCSGKAGAAEANQEFCYALPKFCRDCENFATIAKILQSLRKFRCAQIFAMIAKITVHSENLNFAMPGFFLYDSKISLS